MQPLNEGLKGGGEGDKGRGWVGPQPARTINGNCPNIPNIPNNLPHRRRVYRTCAARTAHASLHAANAMPPSSPRPSASEGANSIAFHRRAGNTKPHYTKLG